MLIILEGARNSGKTTVARMIKEAVGPTAYLLKFERTTRPAPPVFMIDFLTKNYLALVDSRSVAILDRFHLTEFVMRSLDGKVEMDVLMTTTHMIDYALKNIGAVTYILEADQSVRSTRLKMRDLDHNKNEWPDLKELDGAWAIAKKNFSHSKVRPVKSNTREDTNKIVADALTYVGGGKLLNEKIPFYPPIVELSVELMEV